MSFDAFEKSTESGRPIRCYRFMIDNPLLGNFIRPTDPNDTIYQFLIAIGFPFPDPFKLFGYTSADTAQFLDDGIVQVWCAPMAIKDDGVKFSGDKISDTLNITASSDIEPAQWFRRAPPGQPIRVSIHDRHVGDNEFTVTYVGEITEASFDSPGEVKFSVNSIGASLDREGLRLCWQRSCTHTIYDPVNCGVNPADWRDIVTVVNITPTSVTVDGMENLTNGKFNGGFLEFDHPVKGLMSLTIRSQSANVLQIFEGTEELFPGMTASIYPGCNHTPAACTGFNNFPRYGGVRSLPGKSPFDGSPVF